MTLSGPGAGKLSSRYRLRSGAGPGAASAEQAAARAGKIHGNYRCTAASGGNPAAAAADSSACRATEFDAAQFVEFVEEHLHWLDRVDKAESSAWRAVRSEGGRVYTCVHIGCDDEAAESICVDLHSGELLTSPECGYIPAGSSSAVIRNDLDRPADAIEATIPVYDVPDPSGFSAMLNIYFRDACRADLSFLLERLPPARHPDQR